MTETFEEIAARILKEVAVEEEEALRTGFHYNDNCWTCKKEFKKLRWIRCGNGTLTFHCNDCYNKIMKQAEESKSEI